MSEKKKYDLMFRYTDNHQIYDDQVILDDDEVIALKSALLFLVSSGHIESHEGNSSLDNVLVEYRDPSFLTLDELKTWWRSGYLQDQLDDAGFIWPGSKE